MCTPGKSLVGRSGNFNHMKAEGAAGKGKEGHRNSGRPKGSTHLSLVSAHPTASHGRAAGTEGSKLASVHPKMLRGVSSRLLLCPEHQHFLQPSTWSLDNSCSQTHSILLKFPKCNISNSINSCFALTYQIFKPGSHQS